MISNDKSYVLGLRRKNSSTSETIMSARSNNNSSNSSIRQPNHDIIQKKKKQKKTTTTRFGFSTTTIMSRDNKTTNKKHLRPTHNKNYYRYRPSIIIIIFAILIILIVRNNYEIGIIAITTTIASQLLVLKDSKQSLNTHRHGGIHHHNRRQQQKQQKERFVFRSGNKDYDNAYRLAMDEIKMNIEHTDGSGHGHFVAGAGWKQLWTRDTAYAIELGAGLLYPEVSKRSLMKCTETTTVVAATNNHNSKEEPQQRRRKEEVWLQDSCGHFGGWPHLSDAIVGARGAWTYYLVSGDLDFLEWAYRITRNSLDRAENSGLFDETTGLIRGCSSFMESNSGYPQRYQNKGELVAQTKALSTNLLYYSGYALSIAFVNELVKHNRFDNTNNNNNTNNTAAEEQTISSLQAKADKLRTAIRTELWLPDEGYYSYAQTENHQLLKQMEALGESLVLLIPGFETDPDRIESVFETVQRMIQEQNHHHHHHHHQQQQRCYDHNDDAIGINGGGIPCLWPKFTDHQLGVWDRLLEGNRIAATYHNGNIWPFVQGYWAMAAARHGKEILWNNELKKLLRLSQQRNTFAEYYEVPNTAATATAAACSSSSSSTNTRNRNNKESRYYYYSPHQRQRQLWSDTGFVSMIFYGLFGIHLRPNGIYFRPVVPAPADMELNNNNHGSHTTATDKKNQQIMSLLNVVYRDMTLDIYVNGSGTTVQSFFVDGQRYKESFLSNNNYNKRRRGLESGFRHHKIEIIVVSSSSKDIDNK